ncbi:MAG: DUF63 family protein [Candidatus Anstonellaceae archaeon]
MQIEIGQWIEFYFIKPILHYEGYNIVNTFTYALLALTALFLIYKFIKKNKIKIGEDFFYGVIGFIFFGSFFRVCVDTANNLNSYPFFWEVFEKYRIFDYSILTTSPVIYLAIAVLFFITYYFEIKLKIRKFSFFVGSFLALACFSFLYFFLKHLWIAFIVLTIATIVSLIIKKIAKFEDWRYWLIVFAHSLDGAATWIAIEILPNFIPVRYQEQHVLPNIIANLVPDLGFFSFFILKVVIASLAAKLLKKEPEGEIKEIIILAIIVIGLAPGIRDVLRAVVEV